MVKRRRFAFEIILLCVRWYCKYGISCRDLVEMMQERGVEVDPSTTMRWVHRFAPELEKRVRWYRGYRATSWRTQTSHPAHLRLSDNEEGVRYDQGLQGDANNPPRSLPHVQTAGQGRGAFHQQAVRRLHARRLINGDVATMRPTELMQQSRKSRIIRAELLRWVSNGFNGQIMSAGHFYEKAVLRQRYLQRSR